MQKTLFFLIVLVVFTACEKVVYDKNNYNSIENNFEVFWKEVDRNYAFFPYLNIDWDSVYSAYKPRITNNMHERQLFDVLSEMANLLKDGHVNLFSPYGVSVYSDWYKKYPVNTIKNINRYLESFKTATNVVQYGKIRNRNIGYISVSSFVSDSDDYSVIDEIITNFANTDGIVIDVRSNGGGNSNNAMTIASRFADITYFIFKTRFRNGKGHDDFTDWTDVFLYPEGVRYNKNVAVLTNRSCYSSTEWFISAMKVMPRVTIVGDTTGGGSGNPLQRQLPNGWFFRLSNSQKLLPEGVDFQFTGIYPDVPVSISKADSTNGIDTILEKAITLLEEAKK